MKKLLALGALLATLVGFGLTKAQVVNAPTGVAAIVCAVNSIIPSVQNGKFFYAQCDSSGHLLTSSASSPSVLNFGATGNTVSYTDGAITGSTTAFCSATQATFTAADVGKYILIHGAGAAGIAFQTTISALVSTHCVTIASAVSTGVSGASFTYGTDDTAAITAAVASITNGTCLNFPAGAYWFASQTTAISLQNICLKGTGQTQSKLPYTNQGSVLVFTETASSEFTIGSGVTFNNLGFYYPAQDGSAATPITYPAMLTSSNMFNFSFSDNYVVDAYQFLQTTDGGGSAIGRAYFHNNRIYAVDTAFYFQGGAADEIAIDSTNIFSLGVYQDITTTGSQFLANYTNTTGTIYKIDVGTAGKASIDGLKITGAFHYGYRYGIRILSGLLDNSVIAGSTWDAIPTVLSVEGTTGKTDGLNFTGNWVYSLESFGALPAAAAFHTINYSTTVNSGRVTFTGNHFTYSQANFFLINSSALNSIEISGNTFAAWGQSTTNNTYYAIVCSDGSITCTITGNIFAAQTVVGSFQIGVDIVSKASANINGNSFIGNYYGVQDVSSSGNTILTGNNFAGTVSSKAVNNGTTSTALVLACANQFDKSPISAITNNCPGLAPNYIANNWYLPPYLPATGAGSLPGSGTIHLYPVFIPTAFTINNLGVRVTTLSVSGNVQAAIYANNYVTGRPTGTALVSTASMSTTNIASVSAAASLSLQPGIYWFATNCDNATAIFGAFASTSMIQGWMIGSATQSADFSGTTGLMGLTVSQTFGTWPDLTAAGFTEVGSINSIPIVQWEIASVP